MANPNKAWKYRGPRIAVESREVYWSDEDEVRAELKAKYPDHEVRKVRRKFGRGMDARYKDFLNVYKKG